MHTDSITLTVYFNGSMWQGLLRKQIAGAISMAKHVFGTEPTDPELYKFVLHEIQLLNFSDPKTIAEETVKNYRGNFKRMQREVRKSLKKENFKRETLAQEVIRLQLEFDAKQKSKKLSREQRDAAKKEIFKQKQAKKKQKLKGH